MFTNYKPKLCARLAVDRFKCASALYFTQIIFKRFNVSCFGALAYTTLVTKCAVFFCVCM